MSCCVADFTVASLARLISVLRELKIQYMENIVQKPVVLQHAVGGCTFEELGIADCDHFAARIAVVPSEDDV